MFVSRHSSVSVGSTNFFCGIVNEITIPTNRTNRSIRQSCTGSPLSLMRCNCPIDDRTNPVPELSFLPNPYRG